MRLALLLLSALLALAAVAAATSAFGQTSGERAGGRIWQRTQSHVMWPAFAPFFAHTDKFAL